MLYLNLPQSQWQRTLLHLTLTSVVFESKEIGTFTEEDAYLTLTSVVFEF